MRPRAGSRILVHISNAPEADRATATTRATLATAGLSVLLLAALAAVYVRYDSQLALAQAADSFMDVAAALGLWWAVRVGAKPPDPEHPFGHQNAESIAALCVAMLAGVLAFEVGSEAVMAWFGRATPHFGWPLAAAFGLKVVAKAALFAWASGRGRRGGSPALVAIAVDARNDVLVGAVGLLGFGAARLGWPQVDAILALPIALWVGFSGLELGLENVARLMGEAPDEARQRTLRQVAASVPGVTGVGNLRARAHGTQIEVWVEVYVDGELSVRQGHDVGERVEAALEAIDEVSRAEVHVDASP